MGPMLLKSNKQAETGMQWDHGSQPVDARAVAQLFAHLTGGGSNQGQALSDPLNRDLRQHSCDTPLKRPIAQSPAWSCDTPPPPDRARFHVVTVSLYVS